MTYLVDTNVVSELRKVRSGKAHPNVGVWSAGVDAAELYLSVVTVQELEIGILLTERRDPQQGALLRAWMNLHVLPAFLGRILPVDLAVAQISAKLYVPDPKPFRDGLIAATALAHSLTVVTRNVADFAPMGVDIVNPWAFNSST